MSDSMSLAQGYMGWFGLSSAPFTIAPDPGFLYPSTAHREALAHLRYGLDREGGFILLTGEVGTGKTTLTRLLLEQLPAHFDVAYLLCTRLDAADLLASICDDLGIEVDSERSLKANVDALNKALLERHAKGRRILLVFEEAQSLSPDVLEFLRMLTNLETNTEKLLHILLVGQPELLETLADRSLRQLDQRVVARYHLRPLTLDELDHYVAHRLSCSGCTQPVFGLRALKHLHRLSDGIPRLINLIGERCLVGAYAQGKRDISPDLVRSAASEVLGGSSTASRGGTLNPRTAAVLVTLALVVAALGWWLWPETAVEPLTEPAVAIMPGSAGSEAKASAAAPASVNNSEQAEFPATVEQLLADSPAKPVAGMTVMTAYETLLAAWSIYATAADSDALCSIARSRQLRCETLEGLSYQQLGALETPTIVTVRQGAERSETFMLAEATGEGVTLLNSGGETRMSVTKFGSGWNGSALILTAAAGEAR